MLRLPVLMTPLASTRNVEMRYVIGLFRVSRWNGYTPKDQLDAVAPSDHLTRFVVIGDDPKGV